MFLRIGLCAVGLVALGAVPGRAAFAQDDELSAWDRAVEAHAAFESTPAASRTRVEFARVMDGFRAIYHANPSDLHAPRAVNEVAELLAEQGHELNDPKSLRAAAGQYEFLAKAYPTSSLAPPALGHALELLGPTEANDPAEAANVRHLLREQFPHSAAARDAKVEPDTAEAAMRPSRPVPEPAAIHPQASVAAAAPVSAMATAPPESAAAPTQADEPHYVKPSTRPKAPAVSEAMPASSLYPVDTAVRADAGAATAPAPAVVSGVRHWSTATYTRVAIDLGGEVQFKAARVEHPDRIFFDLHGAKLAPGLAGKSFAITDDGYLRNIRAAQSGPDVTRIVLDVQPVAEYSAFLLPNPYRLIIDIHGRQPGREQAEVPTPTTMAPAAATRPASGATQTAVPRTESLAVPETEPSVAPVTRVAPPVATANSENSTFPPMPVTDGSASFGLPPKRDAAVTSNAVARPRVVVSAKPTAAKPVPNSVTSTVPEGSREVAAVSEGPGVIAANAQPTSRPVVDRANRTPVRGAKSGTTTSADTIPTPAPAAPPPPTSEGQSTLMRALGLKIGRIVIDAGHGGHDSGTLGPDGIEEKDVVLDVALRLGKLLHDRLGAEVVYTRADDTFIPLETRTAIANKAQADLFISVHANSSPDPSARGVEVYYLNFTSDPEAMQVASRENAVSSQRVNQLSDLVKQIALKDKIDESRELAGDVDQSLYAGLHKGNAGLKDRGVKKAPFVVLIGANMPSILAEISFVTNPDDATKLDTPEYRERVAESLYNGIARYAGAINGPKGKPRPTERAQR